MGIFAGLFSLFGLSLFLSWVLRRSSAFMPFLAVCLCMVFFTFAGVFGFLFYAGYVWYTFCFAAFAAALVANKKNIFGLISPGLVLFFVGSAALITFYLATKPMLTQWDEFTFWGTAAKATGKNHLLYTLAQGNLIARSYPPGLIVFAYMMQFFVPDGFSEPGLIASFAVLYMACFSLGAGLWGKNKTAAILHFAAFFMLPFFFAINSPAGQMQWAFQLCMADVPMALVFGGSLCFYFAGGQKDSGLILSFGAALFALVCIKDMGFALALIALFAVLMDMAFCRRKKLQFLGLRSWWALLAAGLYGLFMVFGAYQLWAWHLGQALGVNRFNLGSASAALSPVNMVLQGIGMLFGKNPTQQFSQVLALMLRAFYTLPVCLLGNGLMVLCLIFAVSALAFALCTSPQKRFRLGLFTLVMCLCFAAFYIFNIFTYALIFKPAEALVLKDYQRYISPFYMAWLMLALVFLAKTSQNSKATFYRLRLARGASGLVFVLFVLAVFVRGNWQANFLRVSPSYYQARISVQKVLQQAKKEGMADQDVVYLISQGDDGSRFYLFGYEMQAKRALVFNGYLTDISGKQILDEADKPQFVGNVAATLVAPGQQHMPLYGMPASKEDITVFLRQEGATHVLLDVPDEYIFKEFGGMFEDGLEQWQKDGQAATGQRYYRINWRENGTCNFVAEKA